MHRVFDMQRDDIDGRAIDQIVLATQDYDRIFGETRQYDQIFIGFSGDDLFQMCNPIFDDKYPGRFEASRYA